MPLFVLNADPLSFSGQPKKETMLENNFMDVVLFQNVGTYKTWIPSDFWTKQMGSDGYFKGDIGKHASDKMTVCISAMNDELIAITKELTEAFRKSHTVDWEELARAGMRRMVKRLIV